MHFGNDLRGKPGGGPQGQNLVQCYCPGVDWVCRVVALGGFASEGSVREELHVHICICTHALYKSYIIQELLASRDTFVELSEVPSYT